MDPADAAVSVPSTPMMPGIPALALAPTPTAMTKRRLVAAATAGATSTAVVATG